MSIDNLSELKALKLFGMATALAEIRAEASRHADTRRLFAPAHRR